MNNLKVVEHKCFDSAFNNRLNLIQPLPQRLFLQTSSRVVLKETREPFKFCSNKFQQATNFVIRLTLA